MSPASRSGSGRRARHQRIHELQRGLRRLRHLVFQLPGGVVGEAQQLGLLRAQLGQPGNDVAGIVRSAAFGAIPGILEQRLPRRAMAQRIQVRLLRGVLQRNHVALQLALFCRQRGGADLRIALSPPARPCPW